MITQELLETMTARLVAEFAPARIYLFGSQAWGLPRPDSDVDLLVVVPDGNAAAGQSRLERGHRARRVLRDIGVAKDVIVETDGEFAFRASPRGSLEDQVSRRGRRIYG